jgi:hypothetical protein
VKSFNFSTEQKSAALEFRQPANWMPPMPSELKFIRIGYATGFWQTSQFAAMFDRSSRDL